MKKKFDFLTLATNEAKRGILKGDGGPFGAVIVRNGLIIAQAHNTVLKSLDPTCHAEINAIRKATRKLKKLFLSDCTIYSTTEPCPMCFSAIHWARIKKVFYSTTISDVKKLGFNELAISNHKMKRLGKSKLQLFKVSHDQCRDLLRAWSKLPSKKTY